MRVRKRFRSDLISVCWLVLCGLLQAACTPASEPPTAVPVSHQGTTAAQVARLIAAGDASYAEKSSYQSFRSSLKYYDSARALADGSGDTLQLAEAIFAKGRVYDAWNKDPQKTIALFTEAATYFKKVPEQEKRYLYVQHLVAHAYDKIQDSVHATALLRELYTDLASKDSLSLQQLPFTAEMALIATEVRAYSLADSILRTLTRRAWIANDSATYDYLNHYYLTQSRLDAYWRKPAHSYYLDSLQDVYNHTANPFDRLYYSFALAALYRANHAYRQSSDYYALNNRLHDSLNNRTAVADMQQALLQSEQVSEKRKREYEEAKRVNRLRIIWLLGGLLSIITALSMYLYGQARKSGWQAERLASLNNHLDERIRQVELLNKEIQHRVKNNLHMIYSLLQMQERKTDSEEVVAALQAARLRVESVAALHNQLLTGKGTLNLTDYIKSVVSSVVNCLSNDINVITHITTDEVNISEDNYFELSLILNEWVTNSIKYAVIPDTMLEINVSVRQRPHEICIEYSDSGHETHAQPGQPGLGTQIIRLLTVQMGARLTTIDHPYHYQLCIPDGD